MRWLWRRRARPAELATGQRWRDGDTVLHPGDRRSVEILRAMLDEQHPASEPTRMLPLVVEPAVLRMPAQRWRAAGGAS